MVTSLSETRFPEMDFTRIDTDAYFLNAVDFSAFLHRANKENFSQEQQERIEMQRRKICELSQSAQGFNNNHVKWLSFPPLGEQIVPSAPDGHPLMLSTMHFSISSGSNNYMCYWNGLTACMCPNKFPEDIDNLSLRLKEDTKDLSNEDPIEITEFGSGGCLATFAYLSHLTRFKSLQMNLIDPIYQNGFDDFEIRNGNLFVNKEIPSEKKGQLIQFFSLCASILKNDQHWVFHIYRYHHTFKTADASSNAKMRFLIAIDPAAERNCIEDFNDLHSFLRTSTREPSRFLSYTIYKPGVLHSMQKGELFFLTKDEEDFGHVEVEAPTCGEERKQKRKTTEPTEPEAKSRKCLKLSNKVCP